MPKIGRIFSCAELDELIQESSLTTKTSQMRHLKRHVRSYPCEQCDKSLTSKHGLKKHVNSKHRGVRVNCDYKACQTTFSSNDAKRDHAKSVHQKHKFPCDQCPKQFSTKSFLLMLISHVHHNKTSNCNICDKSFADKEYLRKHMMTVHGGRTFKCDQCDGLSRHKSEVHKGIRYKCEVCCKTFRQLGSLKSHQKNHQ